MQEHTLEGRYYDGLRATGSPATLHLAQDLALTVGRALSQHYPVESVRVSPRVALADRFISLPGGGQFQCKDSPVLDRLPAEVWSEGVVAWLERRFVVAILCVAVVALGAAAAYFYGVPAVADYVVERVAPETEQALGRQSLEWLDEWGLFKPSRVGPPAEDWIRSGFSQLHAGLPMAPCYQLELRDAATIGPNAFALPGGIIVVTDQLVDETESINEVLAILAHEIGHTELRHPLRSVLHGSLTAIIAATITADAGSLSAAVTSLPFILLQTKYSREMESAADEFAFRLLRQHDLSPELFAKALERLSKGSSAEEHAFSFLSTHPVTAERIERARAAARVKPAEAYRRGFDLGAFPRPPEAEPGIPVDR